MVLFLIKFIDYSCSHDTVQNLLAEMSSLLIEYVMRVGESWLIEPMLPADETNIVIPPTMNKQEHQCVYANQMLNKLITVSF